MCRRHSTARCRPTHFTNRSRRVATAMSGASSQRSWAASASTSGSVVPEDNARKLLAHATLLTEQLASDAALDETARRHLQATLVTRYYQLSRLSENLPDVPDASQARESLLDMTRSERLSHV